MGLVILHMLRVFVKVVPIAGNTLVRLYFILRRHAESCFLIALSILHIIIFIIYTVVSEKKTLSQVSTIYSFRFQAEPIAFVSKQTQCNNSSMIKFTTDKVTKATYAPNHVSFM